ncbi:MAG: hypothetical protein EBV30_06515, partial [Actinobacteria bacterium]|nr:hypothetical protein [Actinomycetota bacterium]
DFSIDLPIRTPSNFLWRQRSVLELPPLEQAKVRRFLEINNQYGEIFSSRSEVNDLVRSDATYIVMNWLPDLIEEGWTAKDLFDRTSGFVHSLRGRKLASLDGKQAIIEDGEVIRRMCSAA